MRRAGERKGECTTLHNYSTCSEQKFKKMFILARRANLMPQIASEKSINKEVKEAFTISDYLKFLTFFKGFLRAAFFLTG